jgi:hypothetical protein
MTTAAPSSQPFVPVHAVGRTAAALRSLMHSWEEETVVEDTESETELMVMLSGMVGAHATALDGE